MPQASNARRRRFCCGAHRLGRGGCAVGACRRGGGARCLYKLLIGLGIAGLAVAYQDRLPQVEGRGANVVSSQAADLAPASRIVAHRGAVTAAAVGDQGRWIVSVGSDGTLKVWNAGSGGLVRTIELDEGAATVLALEHQRALTGHKGGAVVLWDLEKAEKLAVFQHRGADLVAGVHGRPQPILRREPGRRGGAASTCARAPRR